MQPVKFGVGQAVTRKEDDPLLRGAGRYVADYAPAGALRAVLLRSPHARARFHLSDIAGARAKPGVRLILAAEDIEELGTLPCTGMPPRAKIAVPPYRLLASGEVRHVGDAIAFVVADTLDQAKDAAEAIGVEWEALPPAIGAVAALAPGAPQVWPDHPDNLVFDLTIGKQDKAAAAFEKAARVVSLTLVNQRITANYLDTRGVVAEYDNTGDRITLTLGSQGSHNIRDLLCEHVFRMPPERMRVVTPDVGGGFGTKLFPYREYALAGDAARRLNRPVKWIAERQEHFLADTQGRDNVTTAKLALDGRGRILALDVDTVADMGAYLSCYAPYIPFVGAGMLPGVYDIPVCHIRLRAVFTNTVPVDAYRGAGRPEAAYVIERLMDVAARELGMAPDSFRRKNFIKPSAMPYRTATGKIYDTGEFAAHMDAAQEIADWRGFKTRFSTARKSGKLRGIGLATYIEACGGNGPETAKLVLEKDGGVTVLIGTQSTGQGHHTAYAQLVADQLGVSPEQVRVIQGDTDLIATGGGTGGSSSIPVGGASVSAAAGKLAGNIKKLAAEALDADASELEFADGAVRVTGRNRVMSLAEVARLPQAQADMLTASDAFSPPAATYPNGTHLTEVEIDPATGETRILSYVVVDDFGMTLNPLLLQGQIEGGAVQGIGQALMENTVYDEDSGQLLTGSLQDYAVPRAEDSPAFIFETRNVPCKTNPLGVKGAGEAGAIGSCPSVMNAVVDALWRAYRIPHVDMPATPERIWAAIEEGRRQHTL